jgi:hypothetical protein
LGQGGQSFTHVVQQPGNLQIDAVWVDFSKPAVHGQGVRPVEAGHSLE